MVPTSVIAKKPNPLRPCPGCAQTGMGIRDSDGKRQCCPQCIGAGWIWRAGRDDDEVEAQFQGIFAQE